MHPPPRSRSGGISPASVNGRQLNYVSVTVLVVEPWEGSEPAFEGQRQALRRIQIQLQQVILNLITNAIGSISALNDRPRDLLVSTAKVGSNGLLVSLRDTGAGLPAEKIRRGIQCFLHD